MSAASQGQSTTAAPPRAPAASPEAPAASPEAPAASPEAPAASPKAVAASPPKETATVPPASKQWLGAKEKGSVFGIRVLVFLCTTVGRRAGRLLLPVIAFYYVVFHKDIRRASRTYLNRIHHKTPSFGQVYRHVLHFARVALDRLFLLRGRSDLFEFHHHGAEHLQKLYQEGRGAILMGGHLGSPSAMAAEGHAARLKINIATYSKNAEMFNSALQQINPQTQAQIVNIDPTSMTSVLAIKDLVDAGEMVVLAGDRVGLNDKTANATFLGEDAPFPLGPFILAGVLRAPVYLVFALYTEPNRYDLYCEPFAESLAFPRKERGEHLARCVQRYAQRLEHYAALNPDNWFNFYDFWSKP